MSDPAVPTYSLSPEPLFDPGRLYITPAAEAIVSALHADPLVLFTRHARGDWGELAEVDRRANARALEYGNPIVSSYLIGAAASDPSTQAVVWIVSEGSDAADTFRRPHSTMLLPGDF
jgi:hypothetical protein